MGTGCSDPHLPSTTDPRRLWLYVPTITIRDIPRILVREPNTVDIGCRTGDKEHMTTTPTDYRLEAIYRAYAQQVHSYCVRRTGREEAKDATAEVFLIAWRRIEDVPSGDDALPWLYTVARNVLANQARTVRRQTRLSAKAAAQFDEAVSGPETLVVINEEHQRLLAALASLPATDQEILRLVEWEGLPRETVAEMMFISRSAVDKRMTRAYKKLSRSLGVRQKVLLPTPVTSEEGGET